jgi:hypothetical protein
VIGSVGECKRGLLGDLPGKRSCNLIHVVFFPFL